MSDSDVAGAVVLLVPGVDLVRHPPHPRVRELESDAAVSAVEAPDDVDVDVCPGRPELLTPFLVLAGVVPSRGVIEESAGAQESPQLPA